MQYYFRKSEEEVLISIEKRAEASVKNLESEITSYKNEITEAECTLYVSDINKKRIKSWWEAHYLLCSAYQDNLPNYFRKPPYPRLSASKKASIAAFSLFSTEPDFILTVSPYDSNNTINQHIQLNKNTQRELHKKRAEIINNIYAGMVLRTASNFFGIKYSKIADVLLGNREEFSDNRKFNLVEAILSEHNFVHWKKSMFNKREALNYIKAMMNIKLSASTDEHIMFYMELITVMNAYFDALWCATTNVQDRGFPSLVPESSGAHKEDTLHEYKPRFNRKEIKVGWINNC